MALVREDIQKMTVKRLRLLDISDPKDEALVQSLIQEKLAEQPIVGSPARARPHATDNLTPETEAALQKTIDAANASKKAHALGEVVVTQEILDENPELVAAGVELGAVGQPVSDEEAAALIHPADQQNEADIEANLAQLEAEKAALTEAEKEPFVPAAPKKKGGKK